MEPDLLLAQIFITKFQGPEHFLKLYFLNQLLSVSVFSPL